MASCGSLAYRALLLILEKSKERRAPNQKAGKQIRVSKKKRKEESLEAKAEEKKSSAGLGFDPKKIRLFFEAV